MHSHTPFSPDPRLIPSGASRDRGLRVDLGECNLTREKLSEGFQN